MTALGGLALGVAACVPFYNRIAREDLPPPPDAFEPLKTSGDVDPPAVASAAPDRADAQAAASPRIEERFHALLDPAMAAVPKAFVDVKTGAMILSRSGRDVFEHMTVAMSELQPQKPMTTVETAAAPDQALDVKPVTYDRDWPEAVTLRAGGYEVEFSPHASLHVTQNLAEAEAGGMVRVWRAANGGGEMDLLGVSSKPGAGSAQSPQRWYLFLGASGRAIDWRAIRDTGGGARWAASSDASTVFLRTAQAGFAWKRGALQTAVAFVLRKATSGGPFTDIYPGQESIVALRVSLRPMHGGG